MGHKCRGHDLERIGAGTDRVGVGQRRRCGRRGVSDEWTMPSWQVGPGVQNQYTSSSACPMSAGNATVSCREMPDVASDADPLSSPFAGAWTPGRVWEERARAPALWAAVAALADQGQSRSVGLMNPALYQSGCLASPPFNDVASGNNQPPLPYLPTDADGIPLTAGPYYPATASSTWPLASAHRSPALSLRIPRPRVRNAWAVSHADSDSHATPTPTPTPDSIWQRLLARRLRRRALQLR